MELLVIALMGVATLAICLRVQQPPEEEGSEGRSRSFYTLLEGIWLELRELNEQRRQSKTPEPRTQLSRVNSMDGYQFEAFIASIFRRQGYKVSPVGSSGDQGVDVLVESGGELCAVQCKNYGRPVGNTPIQEVFAGATYHGANRTMVVAPAGFTTGAMELAERTNTELVDQRGIETWLEQGRRHQEIHGDTQSRSCLWVAIVVFFILPLAISLVLLLIPPVGLYLMWRYTAWTRRTKWIVTVITVVAVAALAIFVALSGSEPSASLYPSSDNITFLPEFDV